MPASRSQAPPTPVKHISPSKISSQREVNMRKLKYVLTATIPALAVAVFALPASASIQSHASPASSTSKSQGQQAVEHHITTKDGTLTYGWRPGGAIIPDTGSDCDFDVCTTIVGESVFVDDWNTQGYYFGSAPLCTVAYFYANGVEKAQTGLICGDGAGVFYADWNPGTQVYADQTVLSNQWKKIPGATRVTIVR